MWEGLANVYGRLVGRGLNRLCDMGIDVRLLTGFTGFDRIEDRNQILSKVLLNVSIIVADVLSVPTQSFDRDAQIIFLAA